MGEVDHVPKVLRHFLPKFWVNILILASIKVTSRLSKRDQQKSYLKYVQNGGGGARPLLDSVQKKEAFF